MKYLKITKLFSDNETKPDYKGLDINQFIAGSQVYDFDNSVCLVKTREADIPNHPDLRELSEEEYNEIKDIINSNSPAEQEKNQVQQLMLAVAELGNTTSTKDAEIQLAIAELASQIAGGANNG